MACTFRVVIETPEVMLEEGYSIVNPILLSELPYSSVNKKIFKEAKGMRNKLVYNIKTHSNKPMKDIPLKLFLIVYRNKQLKLTRIMNIVIGKNKTSMRVLERSVTHLNTYGREAGLWWIKVPLRDAYGDLSVKKVVSLYKELMSDYPGIVEFVVKDEKEEAKIKKMLR